MTPSAIGIVMLPEMPRVGAAFAQQLPCDHRGGIRCHPDDRPGGCFKFVQQAIERSVDADHFTCKAAVYHSGSELTAFRHATFLNQGDSAVRARFRPRKGAQPNGSGAERSGSQNIPSP